MKKEKIEDNKKKEKNMKQTEKENKEINKENIKEMVNKFFNSIGFPIIIGILLFLKTIFFYWNTISIQENIDDGIDFNIDDKKMDSDVLDLKDLNDGYEEEAILADEEQEDDEALFEELSDEEIELADTDLDVDNLLNDEDIIDDEE